MKIKIRDVQKSDYPSIEKIETTCFPKPRTAKDIKKRIFDNPDPYLIVAETGKQVVGYAAGYKEKEKIYFCYMGILPDHQRKGIGQLLLNKQIQIAKKKGYEQVFLKSPNTSSGMLILAIKNGFKIIGYKDKEWGNSPAIWLEKEL